MNENTALKILLASGGAMCALLSPCTASHSAEPEIILDIWNECRQKVKDGSYREGYEIGKQMAQTLNEVVLKDWVRLPNYISRLKTKDDFLSYSMFVPDSYKKETQFISQHLKSCNMGGVTAMKDRAWSPAHDGFIEYLSPKLRYLYLSAPSY